VPNEPGATARVLFRNTEFEYLDPRAWSLDGKAVLTAMQKAAERTWQFAWVSTATGAITVIESVGWAYTDHYDVLNLSPDGRYIAYSAQAVNPAKNFSIEEQAPLQRRVYVLASDGSSKVELLKTADARMPVWTPDNAHLVFLSDLSGRPGLWSIPVRAGKAAGVPSMVRAGIDDIFPIAITRAGTFYYYRQTAGYSAVSIANLNSGASSASEVLVGQGPVWSPDGTAIALSRPKPGVRGAQSGFNVGFNLVVHSFETGEELLFEGPMAPAGPRWFHDRRRLLVPIRDSSQAAGATPGSGAWHAVDPKTGTSTRILAPDPLRVGVIALSGDDTTVYSLSRQESDPPGPQRLVATELATGRSRQVFDFSSLSSLGTDRRNWALSPDGRTLAYQTSSATESHLGLILLESGTYQALYRGPKVTTTGPQWVNDGKFIAWGETVARGRGRLMRMSIAGGSPEFTGIELEFEILFPRISPNGLRIATPISVPSARELWALDNVTALIKGAR
jgi:Tol biopolymer transport system component